MPVGILHLLKKECFLLLQGDFAVGLGLEQGTKAFLVADIADQDGVDGNAVFFPLPDDGPNGTHWNFQKFRNAPVTNAFIVFCNNKVA